MNETRTPNPPVAAEYRRTVAAALSHSGWSDSAIARTLGVPRRIVWQILATSQ